MNERKRASNGETDNRHPNKIKMETSFIILFVLILVFGAVATKAVMKQYKKNG
jgi:hypothetical protein